MKADHSYSIRIWSYYNFAPTTDATTAHAAAHAAAHSAAHDAGRAAAHSAAHAAACVAPRTAATIRWDHIIYAT